MPSRLFSWGLAIILAMSLLIFSVITPSSSEQPCLGTIESCLKCHTENLMPPSPSLSKACDAYCRSCHGEMSAHHKTGFTITGEVPSGIRLTQNASLACYSCHDISLSRYDKTCWKSESLFQKVFRSASKYPNYFLVEKNNAGQLCRNCH